MDEFEKKHEMVQMLLDMLNKNASDEVSGHMMPKHEDGKGVSVEKVSVMPDEHRDVVSEEAKPDISDPAMVMDKMAMGGMPGADVENEPIEVQDDENNSSVFSFRKKKK